MCMSRDDVSGRRRQLVMNDSGGGGGSREECFFCFLRHGPHRGEGEGATNYNYNYCKRSKHLYRRARRARQPRHRSCPGAEFCYFSPPWRAHASHAPTFPACPARSSPSRRPCAPFRRPVVPPLDEGGWGGKWPFKVEGRGKEERKEGW